MTMPRSDRLFYFSLLPLALITIGFFAALFAIIVGQASPAIAKYGAALFSESAWSPESELYGLAAPIVGSIIVGIIATATALVLGIPLAVFLAEYSQGVVRDLVSALTDMMSGVPTIVFALFASRVLAPYLRDAVMIPLSRLFHMVPLFSCTPSAYSLFTAGIALGLYVTPYVSSLIREAYTFIPLSIKEACYGIGMYRYEAVITLMKLLKPAVIASTLLSFARVVGDTTIAALTVGGSMNLGSCILAPGYTVSALIADKFRDAFLYTYALSALYAGALVILLIAFAASFAGLTMMLRWRARIIV